MLPLFRTRAQFLRTLLLTLLLMGALLNLGCALAIVWRPDEVRYGESILYAHAGRIPLGEPLYQPIDRPPYTVAAYTPLYYFLVAGLRALFGPGFAPGRLLSLGAGLVAAGLVGQMTWRRTHALWPALAAGLLFVSLGLVGPLPWFAFYKEDVLGVALALGAIAVLDGGNSRTRVIASALLAALAILTKQTLFGPALIGTIWLACTRRRLAALFVGIVLVVVLSVSLWFELTTHAFFANTVLANANPFGVRVFVYNVILLALFQTGPLLVVAPYLLPRLRSSAVARDLLVGSWVVSLIPMLGLAKEGADFNYWQLFAAATAILATIALWERRDRLSGAWSSFVLGLNVTVGLLVIGAVAFQQPAFIRPSSVAETAFAGLVASARAEPGTVLADPLDTSVLADRPVVLEPLIYKLLEQVGQWNSAPLVRIICAGEVSLLVLGYPLQSSVGLDAEARWPGSVLEALRERMILQNVVLAGAGQRFIYRLNPARTSCLGDG